MTLRKTANILIFILIIIIFAFTITRYDGNKFYYFNFSLISNFALFYGFRNKSFFFDNFFSLLLWLGFWFKLSIQITLMDSMFPEGAGNFDFKPSSYDDVINIVNYGLLGFILGSFIREKFYFHKNINLQTSHITNFYFQYRKVILLIFFSVIILFAILNLKFHLYQKGTIPSLILPLKINYLFGWLLTFGFASISSLIIYAEFFSKIKKKFNGLVVGFLEVFISSISILSRAMIFNGFSLLLGYYRTKEIINKKINTKEIISYLMLLLILFFISLIVVSKLRQIQNFPIGHEVHSYIPSINLSSKNKVIENTIVETNKILKDINQILFLIAGRWVGIEGIMSVYSLNEKSFKFFVKSFKEEFDYNNSFYENKVKKSFHKYKNEPKIYTVYTPGLFAYLFYTGSKFFLLSGVFFMTLIASIFEFVACKISRNNLIFSSLIGNILAYRLAHFGYMPLNSYKIILALLMTIFFVYVILKILKKIN